jgi:transposase
MSRRCKDPLRSLNETERLALTHLSRSQSAPFAQVERAQALLAVANGASYLDAAAAIGRRHGETIAVWVSRFNQDGIAAVVPRHGGGPPVRYTVADRQRILAEVARMPDRTRDGTATWSLTALQKALRTADDGLPEVSTWTIWHALQEAGLTWQSNRSWCPTGTAQRKRRDGTVVTVTDPDAAAKKNSSSTPTPPPLTSA